MGTDRILSLRPDSPARSQMLLPLWLRALSSVAALFFTAARPFCRPQQLADFEPPVFRFAEDGTATIEMRVLSLNNAQRQLQQEASHTQFQLDETTVPNL